MIELVQYHSDEGVRSAFVKTGRKWLKIVTIDAGIRGGLKITSIPIDDKQYMTPLLYRGHPYPVARALRGFKRMAKSHGITKAAKKLLKEAATENKAAKVNAKTSD